tara:strand:+ start:955 stop:1773 length:819 start_codon:yes stop_codon:yes gene_type:complete
MIFYSRYKRFRLENKISLEDIQRRTKIDVDSIKAMESGKFSEISPVYVRLFFKAYLKEIGVDLDEGMSELDNFLNQKKSNSKPKDRKEEKIVEDKSPKFFDIINAKKAINPNIVIGLVGFLILILLSFLLNNSSDVSNIDKENELRISQSLLDNLYVVRTEEVLSEENFSLPITIRFKSNNENYIKYSDKISAKEYFVFDEGNNNQSGSFSEVWNGDNRSFLIANTANFELVFFSEDSFRDFSDSIINDFPVRVDIASDPLSVSITKYIPKR